MDTPRNDRHAVALELRDFAYLLDANLTQALDGDPLQCPQHLDACRLGLEAMRRLAAQHDFVELPALDAVEGGIARLACARYQDGDCATLTDDERNDHLDVQARHLTEIEGVGTATARRLFAAGIPDVAALLALSDEALADLPEIDAATKTRIAQGLKKHRGAAAPGD